VVTLRYEIYGDKQIERKLVRFRNRGLNLGPVFEPLHTQFLGFEREQFESEGASRSGGWAALKPSTIRAKASHGHDPRILRDTEAMFEAFTNPSDGRHIARHDANSFFFGADDPKAKLHQSGTRRMPQRKVVELSETQRRAMTKTVQMWLVSDQ
jgi:hypothetical protein